jgi:small nuclear ribonucleoprotein (snRNP)-like protein
MSNVSSLPSPKSLLQSVSLTCVSVHAHQPTADAAKSVRPFFILLWFRTGCALEYLLILGNISVNEEVVIRLKWGQTEYKGRLVSIDSYMNIQLSGAEEWIDQQMTSVLGQVLIRYAGPLSFWAVLVSGLRWSFGKRDSGKLLLIQVIDATMSCGFKERTRTTETATQRWRDNSRMVQVYWSQEIWSKGTLKVLQGGCECVYI